MEKIKETAQVVNNSSELAQEKVEQEWQNLIGSTIVVSILKTDK